MGPAQENGGGERHDRQDEQGRAAARERARSRSARVRLDEAGMATAEYAIATLAACGFAGLLVAILRGDEVRGLLLGIVQRALSL